MQPENLALKTPYLPVKGTIRSIQPMAADNYLFDITESTGSLASCKPGQFVELWVPGVGECPISVCSGRVGESIQLMVRRAGRVTSALFQLEEGDWVGLRGPYGQGFPMHDFKGRNLCMVAGGLGVAPIRSVWQYALDHREDFGKLILIYGMRHTTDILFRQELKFLLRRRDIDIFIGAEEVMGPELPPIAAQLGRVTDMLRLADISPDYCVAVCGPPVMYKYVIEGLKQKGVPDEQIWLSLERHMKCGIGKCGHCFIGGKFNCKAGPVFALPEIKHAPEAIECADGEY